MNLKICRLSCSLKKTTFLAFIILLINSSCSQADRIEKSSSSSAPSSNQKTETKVPLDRKIIKEGSMHFESTDAAKSRTNILKSISELKGYTANDNLDKDGNQLQYSLTIRVPAQNFDALIEKISSQASKIDHKDIKAIDVTEEYVDVESRIATKKEIEKRYIDLLTKAASVDDILKIEKELGDLRTEIESIEGRFNVLNDRIAFSKLDLVFYEKSNDSFEFASKSGSALANGWNLFLWFLIALLSLWPLLLILALVLIIIKLRRNKNIKNSTTIIKEKKS